ncbi:MAG: hypothetical protein Q8R40_06650 [bacterium]|nr:hypothetical protein [bacterium]
MDIKRLMWGVVAVIIGFAFLTVVIAIATAIPSINTGLVFLPIFISGILILFGCCQLLSSVNAWEG